MYGILKTVNVLTGECQTLAESNSFRRFCGNQESVLVVNSIGEVRKVDDSKDGQPETESLRNVSDIAIGDKHELVLTKDGQLFTRGEGKYGQLGCGVQETIVKDGLRRIDAFEGKRVRDMDCGKYHSVAITESGDLYTWGGGWEGYSSPFCVE